MSPEAAGFEAASEVIGEAGMSAAETPTRWTPWRLWPLLLIAAAMTLFFALDLQRYVSLSMIQARHQEWQAYVQAHFALALGIFFVGYIGIIALSIPISTWVTLGGALFFGAAVIIPTVVCAATIGATLTFFAARTSIGDLLERRAGPWFVRLEKGFQRDQWSYMFFLRVTPVFPFFVVNLVPAFLGVSPTCFIVATFFGVMPVTAVFALTGASISDALEAGSAITIANILSPKIIAALIGLGTLAITPVVYRYIRHKRA